MRGIQPNKPTKPATSLRTAFTYDVRPDEYAARVSSTTTVAAIVIIAIYGWSNGSFHPEVIAPLNGWRSHDPSGALYIETWSSILSDAAQIGFGLWGGVLLLTGLWRLAREGKFAPIYFSLGVAFVGMAVILPSLFPILTQWLVSKYPGLG
jgi:hypothetical protein